MQTVYLETTFISYLVAIPARDLVVAAHQQTTRDWWLTRRSHFHCFASQVVIDEISLGDASEVKKRLGMAQTLPILSATSAAEQLAREIINAGILPSKAIRDAAHISVAAVHGIDYLLTWNCKHLANAQIARRIEKVRAAERFEMPFICTPEELLQDISDD